ncbi:uncharacterized protein LOC125234168 [Leguminivora glycinivorella]|uniref:uncharacterized protein LOC125234168 n=1 Tax=Leguminivora glycinivorella TaxID=1035111 RepID=UPI0020106310|nr:uncharacterized protein LOC125234168 [Leguminivora glycinivorella]
MVRTRSRSNRAASVTSEEERQQLLDEGASAAREREAARASAERAMGADAACPPSPPSGPAGVTEGLSVAGAQPMGAATANSTLRYGLTVETPRSPSYDTTLLWRRDLAKRLRRRSRPTPIPARHPKAAVIDRTTEKRKSLQETTKEVNKPIIKAQSVRSHASSRTVIEAQLSQAELEASERLAEISRRELQLEADMVRKRLDARKLQIRANADSADEHESAGSVRNSNQDRLDEWLENSRDATSKPICKRLTDEPLPKYETPRRPAQAERNIRGLSPDRQQRRRSTTPPARRERSTSPQLDARTPHTAHTRATEGTVAESMLHLFERMQMAARPAPKDIFELPHFYGDVSEWRSFYNTYAETSKRYKFTDYENVARLRMALRGDAKTCVSHVLSTATRPDMIVRILKKQFGRSEKVTYATRQATTSRSTTCLFCGGGHPTPDSRKLAAQSMGARWEWAKLNRICYRCIDAKHIKTQCKAKACGVAGCPHVHHRLLHADSPQEVREDTAMVLTQEIRSVPTSSAVTSSAEPADTTEPRAADDENDARVYVSSTPDYSVLLKVLPVTVSGPKGTAHIFAFLDDGSTLSMIDQDVADEIGAVGQDEPLCIRGIQRLKLSSVTQTVKAKSLNKKRLLEYEHLADLGDECYTGMGVPQMLIGGDFSHLINPTEVRQGGEDEPCAVKTSLGWVFFGRMPRYVPNNEQVVMHCHSDDSDLVEQVKKHWAVEALGITAKDNIRPDDQRAIDTFERTVKKVGQRYEVGQLWAADDIKLPPSFNMAKARLRNLEARMSRDPDFANEYQAQIHKLLEKGYAERIMEPPQSDRMWFLPHFSVYNLNKGKYRAVFDCAAKSQGCALNDFILAGPDLLQSLLGILLRFREWEFAVTADIQEMFLQIQLRREDRHSQLFIWRGSRRDVTPWTYQLNRVCFGNISSPFLAHSVRNRNATDNKDRYPDAVYDIHNNHYMDDYVASYETERELISTATQVRLAHAEASFRLRSYASNSELLMRNIDPEERATGPSHLGEKQQTVLGMTWDPETDTLGYNTKMLRVPDDVKRYERSPTKRELLSAVMSVYDPLGLIAQYMISAKIIFQRVWTKGTDWDERLPAEEAEDFFRWLRALSDVSALRIPRRYATPTGAVRRELHIFSDASTEAYSAAAYWRVSNDEEETQVSLAIAKSRVCPLKVMTVPRLELTAAVVGVRLAETILREQRYPVTKVTYWTDSMVVLGWVRDDARNYRPYVSHRLAEIAEKTDRDAWRYVPTAQNPADRATRCQPAQSVRIEDEWYEGPRFLYGPETSWPSHTSNRTDDLPERKARPSTETSLAIISAKPDPSSVLPDVRRFSSYDRLLNATANVLLFIEKMRTKNKALQLQVRHLRKAEHMWLQCSQRRSFPEELRALSQNRLIDRKSRLYDLAPELGDDGVLRMKTRLGSAPVLYTALQPIILDGREPFTRLLILRAHRRSAHIHNEAVINELRQEYWILHLRPTVKSVARNCALCTLRRATPRAQPLGDLRPSDYRRINVPSLTPHKTTWDRCSSRSDGAEKNAGCVYTRA